MIAKPERLLPGDTIALVSPANVLPARFKKQEEYSMSYLLNQGYKVKNYINSTDNPSPHARAEKLMAAYNDKETKAILPICGGAQVYDILNLLDYDFISKNPKIICGYSFIGALLLAITERAKCVTFMGPHINFLNDRSTSRELLYTVASFWGMLSNDAMDKTGLSNYERACLPKQSENGALELTNIYKNSYKLKAARQDVSYVCLNEASTDESVVYAQSLDSMMSLDQHGISLDLKQKLLLLDTIDDSFEAIQSKLNVLDSRYSLKDTAGIVFTSFTERTDKQSQNLDLTNKNKITRFLNEMSQTLQTDKLYYGFPMGHCRYKLTIPMGVKAKFDHLSGSLQFAESPFAKHR